MIALVWNWYEVAEGTAVSLVFATIPVVIHHFIMRHKHRELVANHHELVAKHDELLRKHDEHAAHLQAIQDKLES